MLTGKQTYWLKNAAWKMTFLFEMVPYQVTFVHFQGVKRVASIYPFDPPVPRLLQGGGDTSNDPFK